MTTRWRFSKFARACILSLRRKGFDFDTIRRGTFARNEEGEMCPVSVIQRLVKNTIIKGIGTELRQLEGRQGKLPL